MEKVEGLEREEDEDEEVVGEEGLNKEGALGEEEEAGEVSSGVVMFSSFPARASLLSARLLTRHPGALTACVSPRASL